MGVSLIYECGLMCAEVRSLKAGSVCTYEWITLSVTEHDINAIDHNQKSHIVDL